MEVLPASATGIQRALKVLREGGVVAHATETCYGLACDLANPDAVLKLFTIKNRPLTQPVSALFASLEQAKTYVEWNTEAEELAAKYLPGPLTLILPMKAGAGLFPIPLQEKRGTDTSLSTSNFPLSTLGLRLSCHPLAQELVNAFGSPISTTSANLHGKPNPYSAEDIIAQFAGREYGPDLILDSGTLPPVPPSTVVNLAAEKQKTERQGGVML